MQLLAREGKCQNVKIMSVLVESNSTSFLCFTSGAALGNFIWPFSDFSCLQKMTERPPSNLPTESNGEVLAYFVRSKAWYNSRNSVETPENNPRLVAANQQSIYLYLKTPGYSSKQMLAHIDNVHVWHVLSVTYHVWQKRDLSFETLIERSPYLKRERIAENCINFIHGHPSFALKQHI